MRRVPFRLGTRAPRWLAAFAFVTAANAPAHAQGQRGAPIATLLVAGPYVTVNGQPASSGMAIGSGDRVVTGPASSAKLSFYRGGSVQLDADTDPDFYDRSDPGFWQGLYVESREYLRCLTRVVLNTGQVYAEGEDETSCVSHGQATMIPRSRFNLQTAPGREVLTVAAGEVAVAGVQPATVPAGTQVSIAGGRIVEQRRVSPAELRRITAWRSQYVFTPPGRSPYPPPTPSPYPPPSSYPGPGPGQYYPFPVPSFPWPGQDGGHRQPGTDQPPPRRGDGPSHPSPAPPSTDRGGSYPSQTPRSGGDRGGDSDVAAPR